MISLYLGYNINTCIYHAIISPILDATLQYRVVIHFWWNSFTLCITVCVPYMSSSTRVGTLIVATIYLQLIQN